MNSKTAQDIQDDIFRRMSYQKKAELIGAFWRAAQELQTLNDRKIHINGNKRTVSKDSSRT